ncbi:MAG: hypothetical protein PF568_01400, partial [Deltaproteobacteria bacterium]|nr:hypothetical protein [Deltaproteobacteria bacterium]
MRLFLAVLLGLFLLSAGNAGATLLLDLHGSQGALGGRLLLTGDTLLVDEQGQPRLTAVDQLLCRLIITAPEEMTITLPAFAGKSYGDFTLLDQGETVVRRTRYGLEHERQWLIEPYNPGSYQLPELRISGQLGTMTTELILPRPPLLVQAVGIPAEEPEDILPPRAPASAGATTTALAALLLAILALAAWLWRRQRQKGGGKPLLPKERALTEIALLVDLPPRQHIEKLAHIVRCYLTSRFDLGCLEQTYPEYGPALAACAEIPAESREIFLVVLERCDLIKFSKVAPAPNEPEEMAEQISTA